MHPSTRRPLSDKKPIPTPGIPCMCTGCKDTGRSVTNGVEHHCACRLGRAMAYAHWTEKALEEAWT